MEDRVRFISFLGVAKDQRFDILFLSLMWCFSFSLHVDTIMLALYISKYHHVFIKLCVPSTLQINFICNLCNVMIHSAFLCNIVLGKYRDFLHLFLN